jgi:hypothetical protein
MMTGKGIGMTRPILTVLLLLSASAALAHEPLWGESPQTFAFGVWHPEVRFGFENASQLRRGGSALTNPDTLRRSRLDGLVSLQFAPRTSLNVKVEIPFAQVWNQQRVGGQSVRTDVGGLGDIVLSAKSRFYQKFGPEWKLHQSYTVGLQLPTGVHDGKMPDGTPLSPMFQPGSGKFGLVLGYAFAWERLHDTTWLSLMYRTDFGGAGRRGDMLQLDANYGYWARRAKRPQDLGILTALGLHVEMTGRDRLASGLDFDSGYVLTALQANFMATKGQAQFRVGVLVPLVQHIGGTQLRPEWQMRAGFEILL